MTPYPDDHEPKGIKPLTRHYLGDLIYGANDGLITTFAVVSGVTGASLEARIILILGFANLLADGFSMGASNFLAIRSAEDVRAVEGRDPEEPFAERHATATFTAFVIAGAVPLLSYLFTTGDRAFPIAIGLTLACLFVVGAARSLVTTRPWWRAGGEMLIVGAAAALVAYGVGAFIEGLVP
jgi:VIT1/CCC1 family predicted Fe2+/Mn2+ transporter